MKTLTTQFGALALSAAAIFLNSVCASATVWQNGDLTTYGQGLWGDDGIPKFSIPPGPAADLLMADFNTVFAPTGGAIAGSPSGFTLVITNVQSVFNYMPSIGPYAPLNSSYLNPTTTSSGRFGGDVMALLFNVDFSDAGLLPGTSGLRFGNLILADFTGALAPLDGLTVRQFLADMNTLLSGGSSIVTIADLGETVADVNASFSSGFVSQFAQDHLEAPVSATPVPAALPLLAGGLGALGLFGWRTKRKNVAVVAATS
jgi:hypothetical protein